MRLFACLTPSAASSVPASVPQERLEALLVSFMEIVVDGAFGSMKRIVCLNITLVLAIAQTGGDDPVILVEGFFVQRNLLLAKDSHYASREVLAIPRQVKYNSPVKRGPDGWAVWCARQSS